jgi:catalase
MEASRKSDADAGVSKAERRVAHETNAMCAEMPSNSNKPLEYGMKNALNPAEGPKAAPPSVEVTGSTLSESQANAKTGRTFNKGAPSLDGVRVDHTGFVMTSDQGAKVADDQHSLKAGIRGPTLLEDFALLEKITHFDHERIPERVVHARGFAAHGYFECTEQLGDITMAAPFRKVGDKTPVFVRFSTVVGSRGSKDTPRDVRGFSTKFYVRSFVLLRVFVSHISRKRLRRESGIWWATTFPSFSFRTRSSFPI